MIHVVQLMKHILWLAIYRYWSWQCSCAETPSWSMPIPALCHRPKNAGRRRGGWSYLWVFDLAGSSKNSRKWQQLTWCFIQQIESSSLQQSLIMIVDIENDLWSDLCWFFSTSSFDNTMPKNFKTRFRSLWNSQ